MADAHGIVLEASGSGRFGTIPRIIHALPDREIELMTLRRINRLASQVEVLLTLVGESDINFTDAVLVTFIRLWYPKLFEQLPRWRADLVSSRVLSYSTARDFVTEADWLKRIQGALDPGDVDRYCNADAHQVDEIARLISTLFPGALLKGGMRYEDEACRIDSRDYFARYFTMNIPVGDISDDTVRAELATLVSSGELPAESAILEMMSSPQGAALVLRKALRSIDVITESRAGRPAEAAKFLNSTLPEGDRIFGRWATVINALLMRAISDAETSNEAQVIVDDFTEAAGLLTTAEVLYGSDAAVLIERDKLAAATSSIRAGVVDACRRDLTSDVGAENSDVLTCLHFRRIWAVLPSDVIDELTSAADRLISEGRSKAHELAGRFVSVPAVTTTSPTALDSPTFFSEQFETVVPRDKWVLAELPDGPGSKVVRGDRSLNNRINVAAQEMRNLLVSQPQTTE